MKIVIIGGSGLIGSKLASKLRESGRQVLAASPASGVDALSGAGLAQAMEGANVVVDVSNSPSFEDAAVLRFFETSTQNLLRADAAAGVGHHVILSIVGAERNHNSGYMRAKVAQEKLVKSSNIPYTILRATQFFEFIGRIADEGTDGKTVRLPPVLMQPVAADDVAAALAEIVVSTPLNGTVELAGPEPIRLDELARRLLSGKRDSRQVTADAQARYFGEQVTDTSLIPGENHRVGPTRFEDWLQQSLAQHKPQFGSARS